MVINEKMTETANNEENSGDKETQIAVLINKKLMGL